MNFSKSLCRNCLFLVIILMSSSCIYEPIEIYENQVNLNPSSPDINDLELNLNNDTIWIYGNQDIKYHFKTSNESQKVLGLKTYIDGHLVDSVLSDNGNFSVSQNALSEGEHEMSIQLFINSGTGSIIDKLNSEVSILSKSWVIMANYKPKKMSYTIENGYLKLNWEKYKNPDFRKYVVNSYDSTNNEFFIDSLYYGNYRSFTVKVKKTNGELLDWATLTMKSIIPQPVFKISADNKYYFIWPKSLFYNTTKYYYEVNNGVDTYSQTGEKSVNDTVYYSNLFFGDRFYFHLTTMPKNDPNYMMYSKTTVMSYAGEPFELSASSALTSADTVSEFNSSNVVQYSFTDGKTLYDQPTLPNASLFVVSRIFSTRAKYLLVACSSIYNDQYSCYAKNLTSNIVYPMNVLLPYSSNYNYRTCYGISDNGIGIFQNKNREFLFDFINNVEIASRPLPSLQANSVDLNPYWVKIASDGKHYISTNCSSTSTIDVFRANGIVLEKMYSLENGVSKWEFHPCQPNRIITLKNNTLKLIQCEPYSTLSSINFDLGEVFQNIDYFNNEMLSINFNQFIIRSFPGGEILKTIARRPQQYYIYENFILHNHYILKNGVRLNIR